MKYIWLPCAVVLSFCALATAHAFNTEDESSEVIDTEQEWFEIITVVAHRQPRALSEIAGTVTVIDEAELNRYMMLDIADIARYQPGIEVDKASNRFGYGSFRIRGIGGNRSVTVVDNIPMPDNFSVGSYSNAGRGFIELGLASKIEFLRGPASTLYGSKALGGVAAIHLLTVDDLLRQPDRPSRINFTYNSDRERFVTNVAHAFRAGRFSTLLAGVYQQKEETKVAGLSATQPVDRQNNDSKSWLIRTTYHSDYGDIRLTLNELFETNETDIQASLGSGRLATTTALFGDDEIEQQRVVIDWNIPSYGFINRGSMRTWFQQTDTQQDTSEERLAAASPVLIERKFNYNHSVIGVGADFESQWPLFNFQQRIGYGFEWISSEVTDLRDGSELDLASQQQSKILLGEQFPLRDFPKTAINEASVYLHNEIELWQQGLVVSPGIRFEHYELSPQTDALFNQRYPQSEQTALTTNSWLPKLGLLMPLSRQAEWFAQYAKGHRAPPFSDVNIGLYYPQFNVRAISNPDLKSETGQTFETGLRWRQASTSVEVVMFYNKYKNFIQSRAPLGRDPETGDLLFQSINRDRVTIKGSELRFKHSLHPNLDAQLKLSWLKSKDHQTGQSLNSVSPANANLEFFYYSPSMAWETRFIASVAKAQQQLFAADGSVLFATPGYASFDIISRWYASDTVQINLGLYNLTDKLYWRNSSVIELNAGNANIPLLAESGRSVALGISARF